jgi:hypothetical protein
MTIDQIKTTLRQAGVKDYAMVEINGGPDFHVAGYDLQGLPGIKAAMVTLLGHFDATDKGYWFFAA